MEYILGIIMLIALLFICWPIVFVGLLFFIACTCPILIPIILLVGWIFSNHNEPEKEFSEEEPLEGEENFEKGGSEDADSFS